MMMDHYLIPPTCLCLKFSVMILDIHLLKKGRKDHHWVSLQGGWAGTWPELKIGALWRLMRSPGRTGLSNQ